MDYWKDLDVTTYLDYEDFLNKNPGAKITMPVQKRLRPMQMSAMRRNCFIMFGKGKRRHTGGNSSLKIRTLCKGFP